MKRADNPELFDALEELKERDDEILKLRAIWEKVHDALILVLPLALGYACQHSVGRNHEMVEEAQAASARSSSLFLDELLGQDALSPPPVRSGGGED